MKAKTKILAVVVILGAWGVCLAAELHVPAEYPTIQDGIDAAVDGDTVIVADGVYTGDGNRDIDFLGKAITVRSENGPENCIIDCNGTETEPHRGFYFHSGESASSILKGLTIINGNAPLMQYQAGSDIYNYWAGGAILCYQSSPTISNCHLIGNYADWYGGAIGSWKSDAIITGCSIKNNVANRGGGINCRDDRMIISNCAVTNNRATSNTIDMGANIGGGINFESSSDAIITNCVITGNMALGGGGIFAGGYCRPVITNCTFSGNTATEGGAICCGELSSPSVVNSILWSNEAIYGAEIAMCTVDWGSSLSIGYSNIQGGQDSVAGGGSSHTRLNWDEGNIDADPCFVKAGHWDANGTPDEPWDDFWVEGNYRLKRESPCVDAGTDANIYTDIEGNLRPYDFPGVDNNGDEPEFDMGAYELTPVEAQVNLTPKALNCKSKGGWMKAHIVLPDGISAEDIDISEPAILVPFGAQSQYIKAAGNNPTQVEIGFEREAICAAAGEGGKIEAAVVGSLTDGSYFAGSVAIEFKVKWK